MTEAARYLKQAGGIRGNTAEFGKLLNTFYEALAQDREIRLESVQEYAQPVVDWMMENRKAEQGRSEYADEILKELRTSRISLDENRKGEAVCYF